MARASTDFRLTTSMYRITEEATILSKSFYMPASLSFLHQLFERTRPHETTCRSPLFLTLTQPQPEARLVVVFGKTRGRCAWKDSPTRSLCLETLQVAVRGKTLDRCVFEEKKYPFRVVVLGKTTARCVNKGVL